jgi:RNA polymerase sigma-70 factor (family 1)
LENLTSSFESIYIAYYPRLKRFAREFVICDDDAENIVQDVFLELWQKQSALNYPVNISAILISSVKNRCIDFLRHKIVVNKANAHIQTEHEYVFRLKLQTLEIFEHDQFQDKDIDKIITDAINSLPEKCREIFIKSKIEKKKQKEIAEEMNLSINTIESQIAIAYRKLRHELRYLFP